MGESHYQAALIGLVVPNSRYGVDIEAVARIARDPSNPHDSNAVKVTIEGRLVGHLPRDQAERVSAQMAEDGIAAANCRARIKGGWRTNQHDEGLYGVSLGINSWGWIDFGLGKAPPTPPQRPKPAPEGPLKGLRVVIDDAETGGDLQREFAARGAQIMAAVGKTTDYLVLADDHGWDLESPGPGGTGNVWTAAKYRDEGRKIRLITLSEARELGA
ncbi:HIRAN domain-containing protein [Roseivivax halodurans]|uniref:HIRAN domain-containing protein n=1 Tax=Roseivivax halodurans TaxID=93683 RepID=UPI001B7FC5CE